MSRPDELIQADITGLNGISIVIMYYIIVIKRLSWGVSINR